MQITASNIQEFAGGLTASVTKWDANDGRNLLVYFDAINPNVHVDVEILNTAGTVVASKKEKGSALSAGLFISVLNTEGEAFSVIDDTLNILSVEGDPATFAPGKIIVRVSGKTDGMIFRAAIGENVFVGATKVLQGTLYGNGVYELTIPFTDLLA